MRDVNVEKALEVVKRAAPSRIAMVRLHEGEEEMGEAGTVLWA